VSSSLATSRSGVVLAACSWSWPSGSEFHPHDTDDEHEEIRVDVETRALPLVPGVLNKLVAEAGRREFTAALNRNSATCRAIASAEDHQQVVEHVPGIAGFEMDLYGPPGCGTTFARKLAEIIGFHFLDTARRISGASTCTVGS
jgi:hypothetical protein